ncbi:MAG: hypothetical protein KQI62_05605 [Deltaproteobacteria bacterium]|nr:hypothetical protein [Deltaproteobacteria bacterium]
MFRIFIGMLGIFGFSVIITEVINGFHLFNFRIKIPFVAIPALLVFLFYLFTDKLIKKQEENLGTKDYKKLILCSRIFFLLLFMALLVFVPILWWGTIQKLATVANQGGIAH